MEIKNAPSNDEYTIKNFDFRGQKIMKKEELTSKIASYITEELSQRFAQTTIRRIFFEIGEYYSEDDEECLDFHALIATKDESENVRKRCIEDGDGESEAQEAADNPGEYMHEDDRFCIRFPGFEPLEKFCRDYDEALEICGDAVKRIQSLDFSGFKTTDDFSVCDIRAYD